MMHLFYILYLLSDIHSTFSFHFGHSLEEQKNWHRIADSFAKCAYGTYQTPIHIEHHHVENIVMPALEFSGYHNYLPSPITVTNNGHTVKLSPGNFSETSLFKRPQISGALLTSSYVFDSIHFHWGQHNDRGSEHVLNHVRYPMEMHLVHFNTKYNTTAEALLQKDGLVVLAFFFHVRVTDNGRYRPIVNRFHKINHADSSATIHKTFSLATLLPNQREVFFTYEGSLTTPPCSEAVTWFLFPETIPISFKQLEHFRSLAIHDNFRVLQEVGQRRIFMRSHEKFTDENFDHLNRFNVSSKMFWLH